MARRDEDALSWGGDDDPTLETGVPSATEDPGDAPGDAPALPDGWTPVGRGSRSVGHAGPGGSPAAPVPSGAAASESATETSSEHSDDSIGEAGAPATEDAPADSPEPEGLGTVALVSLGVLGGVYLLFAIGWLVGGLRLQGRYRVLVTDSMYQGALWLAAAAPLIWFGTVLFATRNTRSWVRWLWLIFGVLLLIPWPFLMIGAVGR